MWQLRLLISCLLLSGCGAPESSQHVLQIKGFKKYVGVFKMEAARRGKVLVIDDLIIQYGAMTHEKAIGECIKGGSYVVPTIVIKEDYYKKASNLQREQLLFHELGHCVLNKAHVELLDNSGVPVSIMYPIQMQEETYRERRYELLDELFK